MRIEISREDSFRIGEMLEKARYDANHEPNETRRHTILERAKYRIKAAIRETPLNGHVTVEGSDLSLKATRRRRMHQEEIFQQREGRRMFVGTQFVIDDNPRPRRKEVREK